MSLSLVTIEWRSGFRTIGFALFYDEVTNKQVGRFEAVPGFNREEDIEHIRDNGLKLSYQEAKAFFGGCMLGPEQYKYG